MTPLRTTILLLAAACLLPTAAADASYVLFEDEAGDAGPIAAWGVPVPGLANDHADLTGATLDVAAEGATVRLRLASVPAEIPPDIIYFVGWERVDAAFVGVGYFRVVEPTAPQGNEFAFACVYADAPPQEGGEGDCETIDATRPADGFDFPVALALLGDGGMHAPMGAVVRVPDATAWPLFVAHFTGLTVMDFADGEDVQVEMPAAPADPVVSAQSSEAARTVPGVGALALMGAMGAAAAGLARRR